LLDELVEIHELGQIHLRGETLMNKRRRKQKHTHSERLGRAYRAALVLVRVRARV